MKTINVTCGIYSTQYTLTAHHDGTITVKSPCISWTNNIGSLVFRKTRFASGPIADKIKAAFAAKDLILPGYDCASLNDAIEGQFGGIVKTNNHRR